MMRCVAYITIALMMLLPGKRSGAQVDPHFSQYYAYPLYLNPAFTGVIDGDYRATAIYKNQWLSVGKPYSTAGLSLDMTTFSGLNIGLNILQQTAGDGGYRYTQGSVSVSYQGLHFDADGYQRVIFGLQLGFINRRFDITKLRFGDQWAPGLRGDPTLPTNEVFSKLSASAVDNAAGIAYSDDRPDKKVNVYAGFSMNHLTQPEDPFLVSGEKRKLPYRYTWHAGAKINLENGTSITPHLIYMRQGNAEERTFGLFAQRPTSREDVYLLGGVSYRYKDAFIPYAGLKMKTVQFGLSYDANSSTLGRSVAFTNSFELSITIIGKRSEEKRHYFECPPRF
ncbi:MAG: PorP/SprF family type IX secretion system membrane protein [Bacteroidota bacterium]